MLSDIRQDLGNIGTGQAMPHPLEGRIQAFTTGGEKTGLRIRTCQLRITQIGREEIQRTGTVSGGVEVLHITGLEKLQ